VVWPAASRTPRSDPQTSARTLAQALLSGQPQSINIEIFSDEENSASADYLQRFLTSSQRALADPPAEHDWSPLRSAELEMLIDCIRRLDDETTSASCFEADTERERARRRHLQLTSDLARSWLYVCAPANGLLERIPPREDAIPP